MAEKKQSTANSAAGPSRSDHPLDAAVEQFLRQWQSETGEVPPSEEAIKIALRALKQPSVEADTEASLQAMTVERKRTHAPGACDICGHQNRPGSKFCGMCGLPLPEQAAGWQPEPDSVALAPTPADEAKAPTPVAGVPAARALPNGQHFYHHHYHHHYFPMAAEGSPGSASAQPQRGATLEGVRDPSKVRVPGTGGPMGRAEAAVRKLMQDWALACNTRHLDDLVDIYASDAMVLRPNHPPVRGTAAIREFFVSALDTGFGEAELDPLRIEVFGDVAYEAGRCKALVPVAVSKRREERGKYMTLMARQGNGEWKIISDCWSSDLVLAGGADAESPRVASSPAPVLKPGFSRKS